MSLSPDGKRVISIGNDSKIHVWEWSSQMDQLFHIRAKWNGVNSVVLSPDGDQVVGISNDNTIRTWNTATGKIISDISFLKAGENLLMDWGYNSMGWAISPDGKRVVRLSDPMVGSLLRDVSTGEPVDKHLQRNEYEHDIIIKSAAFSLDGKQLAIGYNNVTMKIFDTTTGKAISNSLTREDVTTNLFGDVDSVAFSPDGKFIVGNSTGIFDTRTGKPIGDPIEGDNYVNLVAFSHDGQRIVGATTDDKRKSSTIWIWDARTGKPISDPIKGIEGRIESLAFSHDGQRIVSASNVYGENSTSAIRIWDARTGKLIGDPIIVRKGIIQTVVFSSDGKQVFYVITDKKEEADGVEESASVGNLNLSMLNLLQLACEQLRFHSILTAPTTDIAREAKQTCEQYVWKP